MKLLPRFFRVILNNLTQFRLLFGFEIATFIFFQHKKGPLSDEASLNNPLWAGSTLRLFIKVLKTFESPFSQSTNQYLGKQPAG